MTTPCANFASEISVVGTDCLIANISGNGSCDTPYVISISEAVSADLSNAIECRPDGLYAAPEVLCYHINFSIAGPVSLGVNSSQIYEPITSGSSLTFKTPYLDTASTLGNVVYAIKTSGGSTIATATFPQGSKSGTWSTPSYVMPSTLLISGEVISSGLNASGLSAPMMVCEPNSAFADPGAFYANIDPIQICSMIANNCNATLSVIGGNILQFTANDGSVTNINFNTLIDVCQQVATNCNATLVNNGNGTITFTDNAGSSTVVSLATSSVSSDAGNIATVGTDSGLYVPSRTSTTAQWDASYTGAITTGSKVWQGTDGLLYSIPKPWYQTIDSVNSNNLGSGGTYAPGDVFRTITQVITNSDIRGRAMQGWAFGHFFGAQGTWGTNLAQLQMAYEWFNGISWIVTGLPTVTSSIGSTTIQGTSPFTYQDNIFLAPGGSITLGVRYRVTAATNVTYTNTQVGQVRLQAQLATIDT